MKRYFNPTVEILTLATEDLLTASMTYGGTGSDKKNAIKWNEL